MNENQSSSWWESLLKGAQDILQTYLNYDLSKRQVEAGYYPTYPVGKYPTDFSYQGYSSQSGFNTGFDFTNFIPLLLIVGIIILVIKK